MFTYPSAGSPFSPHGPRQQREKHQPRPEQVLGTKHRKCQNAMLLFDVLSAHLQPRGEPSSWSPSCPQRGCRRAGGSLGTSGGDGTQGHGKGCSTPSHGFRGGQGVSTALSHTAAAHGARGTASHGQGMRSTLSKYYTVSKTKRSKKSKQNSFALNPNLLSSA